MRKLLTLLASVALLAVPAIGHADTIMTGQFQIQGMLTDNGSSLFFLSGSAGIGTQTGSFASLITDGTNVSASNQLLSYTSYVPNSEVITVNSLVADVETFTQTSPGVFSGTVLLSAPGFDDATANLVVTATEDKGGSFPYSLVATVPPPAPTVPEPSTLALFGTGVLGLAGVVRSKLLRG